MLNAEAIKACLHNKVVFLQVLQTVDSTNDYLKRLERDPLTPIVCLAETQTAGKGQQGRVWHSPFGENIYLSLRYFFRKNPIDLSGLSLLVGIAVCEAIESICAISEKLKVKWPNDIIAHDKKIAGILIEIQPSVDPVGKIAIIGIGMNVNMAATSESDVAILQPWTSLKILTGKTCERNILAAAIIQRLLMTLSDFQQAPFADSISLWQQRDYLYGKTLQILQGNNQFNGIAAGITPQGHLLVQMPDGQKRAFAAGEITLIKPDLLF